MQDKNNKQKLTEALEVFDDEFIKEFVKKKVFLLRSIALGLLLLSFLRVYTIIRGKLYAVNDNIEIIFLSGVVVLMEIWGIYEAMSRLATRYYFFEREKDDFTNALDKLQTKYFSKASFIEWFRDSFNIKKNNNGEFNKEFVFLKYNLLDVSLNSTIKKYFTPIENVFLNITFDPLIIFTFSFIWSVLVSLLFT